MRAKESAAAHGELSLELRFICACLAWPRTTERSERLFELAKAALDWDAVTALAERHRVVGLVHYALKQASIAPPSAAAERLSKRGLEIAFEELGLSAELTRVQRVFASQGLHVTVLKGLSAAIQGYGRVGLRQNRDIDLLLAPTALQGASDALTHDGYTRIEPEACLDSAAVERWIHSHKDMVFRNAATGVIIELHWRLFDNQNYLPDLIGAELVQIRLPTGTEVSALAPEAAFAYMSSHGAQHAWSRLKWLADFGALAGGFKPARLEALYREAQTRGLGRPAAQGLLLLADLLDYPIPPTIQRDARRDWRVRALRAIAFKSLAGHGEVEIEDQAFGSTWKTLSHYLLTSGIRYWLSEAAYDLSDIPGTSDASMLRRLGPVAKIPLWVLRRVRRKSSKA